MVNLNDVVTNPGIVNLYQNYAIVNKNVHHSDYKTGTNYCEILKKCWKELNSIHIVQGNKMYRNQVC